MQLSVHLCFPGTCEEAFRFYERVLGGRITLLQTYGASPGGEHETGDWRGKILHAVMKVAGGELLGADVRPGHYEKPAGFYVLVGAASLPEARAMFAELAAGGSVKMSLQATFW